MVKVYVFVVGEIVVDDGVRAHADDRLIGHALAEVREIVVAEEERLEALMLVFDLASVVVAGLADGLGSLEEDSLLVEVAEAVLEVGRMADLVDRRKFQEEAPASVLLEGRDSSWRDGHDLVVVPNAATCVNLVLSRQVVMATAPSEMEASRRYALAVSSMVFRLLRHSESQDDVACPAASYLSTLV